MTHTLSRLVIASCAIAFACNGEPSPSPEASAQRSSVATAAADAKVIFRSKDGQRITDADLAAATGTVNWEIEGPRSIPDEATSLHQQGRQAGSAGKHDDALALFARAAAIAPDWPYPPYDAAFTHLLKGDDGRALEFYAQTVKLAPRGFFTAITALHYLRLEADNKMPRGTYLAYVSLEWAPSPEEKRKQVEALTVRLPAFAPAWRDFAQFAEGADKRLSALESGLAQQPDAETRGFLMMNKALALNEMGKRDDAIALLGTLATDVAQPIDVQQLAMFSLASITRDP